MWQGTAGSIWTVKIQMKPFSRSILSLRKGLYYYYLASLAPNKNLSWILKNAAGNPDKIYVLSGKPLGDDSGVEKLDNVICTGYVSDSEARALMQYCRAFLFPSTYEGFGIPPMEALCMGGAGGAWRYSSAA